jgi:hypothetical protein
LGDVLEAVETAQVRLDQYRRVARALGHYGLAQAPPQLERAVAAKHGHR